MKKRWYDVISQTVNPVAFVLKIKKAETGISVFKDVRYCSRDNCIGQFNECFGEFILETEATRALGLEVIDDDPAIEAFSENHAEIIGIPVNPTTADAKRRAEDFAENLASIARLHHDRFGSFDVQA